MDALIQLLSMAVLIFACDLIWLNVVGDWFHRMGEKIQGSPVVLRWQGAPFVYLAAAYLHLQTTTRTNAFLTGLSAYAIYDFTNYTTIRDYEFNFAVADSLWGGTVFVLAREIALYLRLV